MRARCAACRYCPNPLGIVFTQKSLPFMRAQMMCNRCTFGALFGINPSQESLPFYAHSLLYVSLLAQTILVSFLLRNVATFNWFFGIALRIQYLSAP